MRAKLTICIAATIVASWQTSPCAADGLPSTFREQTWTQKMGAGFKSGTSKIAALVKPKPDPAMEAELQPDKKPGPGVYVALAEMQESQGNVAEAEVQLRKALSLDPNHLGALLAYAHLEDRQRNFQAAMRYYNKALKKHGKDASVHNDMGLCYHRHSKLPEAAKALGTAVDLEPDKKLYRANLAAVLVDQGNTAAALTHLIEANGEPVGHYNLAYLLMQKGDKATALQHFQQAAQIDPTFAEAQHWVAQLSRPAAPYPPIANGQPAALMASRTPPVPYTPGSTAQGAAPQYRPPAAQPAPGYYPPVTAPPQSAQPGSSRRTYPGQ
ncbi:MAG: tetratricopeptide repeat protein [Pirellulales bacterium]